MLARTLCILILFIPSLFLETRGGGENNESPAPVKYVAVTIFPTVL